MICDTEKQTDRSYDSKFRKEKIRVLLNKDNEEKLAQDIRIRNERNSTVL